MSFFLLPPVSYQTQEKLKKNMEEKKSRKKKHSHSSRSGDNSPSSSTRPSISSGSYSYSGSKYEGSLASSCGDSIFTINSGSGNSGPSPRRGNGVHSVFSNKSFMQNETSSVLTSDSHNSLVSDMHLLSILENDSVSTLSKTEKEFKDHSMNYSYSTDMNEILRFNSDERKKKKRYQQRASRKHELSQKDQSSNLSQYTASEIDALEETDEEPRTPLTKSDIDYTKVHASQEENCLGLTRVYSNVSSIFSTKGDSASLLEKVPSNQASVRSRGFTSRFKKHLHA